MTEKIFSLAKNRMYSALNAYHIWKYVEQAININNEGGAAKAQENLDWVINKYQYFFRQTGINSYKTFIADLAIFFDSEKYEESFSLKKVIAAVKDTGVDMGELEKEIEEIKKPHGKLITLIMKLRNQDVAHQALDPKQHIIKYEEVEALFEAVQQIMNKLSIHYNDLVVSWRHVEGDMRNDMDLVFKNLKRGEKERLRDIEKKYNLEADSLK